VRAGTEIQVVTERPEIGLSVAEMDQGSWVIFELPGFTNAASGTEKNSLDALRQSNETSYFRDGNKLWVKLVIHHRVLLDDPRWLGLRGRCPCGMQP
jgi:hypothetical protein